MKSISQQRLLEVLGTVVIWFTFGQSTSGYPNPPRQCQEYGPHYGNWSCLQPGAILNPGQLTWTNLNFCLGADIPAPGLTGTTISTGLKKRDITYDCDRSRNYSETNTVSYAPYLCFNPALPAVASVAGTKSYTAFLQAIPDAACANLGPVSLGPVTVCVVNPDADTSEPEFTITAPPEGANL